MVDFGIAAANLQAYAAALSLPNAAAAAQHLAAALSRHPVWDELRPCSLCVKTDGSPQIALLGAFDPPTRSRLEVRIDALHAALKHFIYLDDDAVRDCVRELAEALRSRFGDAFLRTCRFTGLPRGGAIVLGWLAYALGLSAAQLDPSEAGEAVLVVVDDCVITGARFGTWLQRQPHERVIFATLYAPPPTRQAIEAREPRVLACVSARELGDYGAAELGSYLPGWKETWASRLEGPRYWLGRTDHLCFPWNEPDRSVFDPVTHRVEPAWNLVAPPFPSEAGGRVPVVRIPAAAGALLPAPGVVYGEVGEWTVISHLESRQSVGLCDTAAEFWRVLMQSRSREEALAVLQSRYPDDPHAVAADFDQFVGELESQGFLPGRR